MRIVHKNLDGIISSDLERSLTSFLRKEPYEKTWPYDRFLAWSYIDRTWHFGITAVAERLENTK